jgi:hypothetical protein
MALLDSEMRVGLAIFLILVLPVSLIRNEMEGEAKEKGKGRSTR